jgi:hypothetical protein
MNDEPTGASRVSVLDRGELWLGDETLGVVFILPPAAFLLVIAGA